MALHDQPELAIEREERERWFLMHTILRCLNWSHSESTHAHTIRISYTIYHEIKNMNYLFVCHFSSVYFSCAAQVLSNILYIIYKVFMNYYYYTNYRHVRDKTVLFSQIFKEEGSFSKSPENQFFVRYSIKNTSIWVLSINWVKSLVAIGSNLFW